MSSPTPSPPLPNPAFDPARRPSRLKDVQPRSLSEINNSIELVATVASAIRGASPSRPTPRLLPQPTPGYALAHQRLYEDAGILHGDINNNTIIILDHPDDSFHGALVDFDYPVSVAARRKLANPDPAMPPPRRRYM